MKEKYLHKSTGTKKHHSHHNWYQNSWRTRSVSPNWRGSSFTKAVKHSWIWRVPPKLRGCPSWIKGQQKNTMCDVFLSRHDCFKPPSNYILEVVDGSEPFPALKSCHGSLTYPDNPWVYVWSDCLFRLPLIQCLSWLSWFWRAQSFTPTPRETATFSVTPAPPSSSIKSHCSMNCWWTQSPPVALSLEQNDAFTQSLAKIHYN